MPTLRADNVAASYIYYDAQADDARLTLTVAKTAADHGAASSNYATVVGLDEGRGGQGVRRARAGRRRRDRRAGAHRRQRDRRVGRRRACARRGPPPGSRSGRRRASTSRCRGRSCATRSRSSSRSRRIAARCSSCRGAVKAARTASRTSARPTPTTTVRSTTRRSPPTTSRTSCARSTARSTTTDHRSRHPRHVGRPAAARRARPRANARPTSHAGTRCRRRRADVVTVTGGKLTTYRRMAADAVDADRRRARVGAAAADEARHAARRRRLGRAGHSRRRSRSVTAATPARSSSSNATTRSSPEPLIDGLPYSRAEVVYAVARRDGAHRRRRALAPHPRAAAGARCVGRRGERRRRAHGRRARVVGRGTSPPGRALPRRSIAAERAAGGLPETALDALSQPPRDLRSLPRPWRPNRGAPTPPIAFGGGRGARPSRHEPRRGRRRVARRGSRQRARTCRTRPRRSPKRAATGGRSR